MKEITVWKSLLIDAIKCIYCSEYLEMIAMIASWF